MYRENIGCNSRKKGGGDKNHTNQLANDFLYQCRQSNITVVGLLGQRPAVQQYYTHFSRLTANRLKNTCKEVFFNFYLCSSFSFESFLLCSWSPPQA